MFIIPYVETTTEINTIHVTIYRILMIGGTRLWQEDISSNIEDRILHPNDIYLTGAPYISASNVALCRVDTKKTRMDDYYMWEDLGENDDNTFCWRTFYMIDKKWLSITDDKDTDITILFNAICLSHLNPDRVI